jgi:vitamin K-dependent gamma-carboxylase-like protein
VSPIQHWQAFWFPAVPVRRLAGFRIVMTAYALFDVWLVSGFISRYARVDDEFYTALVFLRPLPRLDPSLTGAIYAVLVVSLAFALVGCFTRQALWIAAPLYLWWWGTYYSFGAVHHGRIAVVVALFVLAVGPSGRAYSVDSLRARRRAARLGAPPPPADQRDELAGWALRVMMVLIVGAYTLAAYSKLRVSGPAWVTGGALQAVMIKNGTPAAMLLVRHLWLVYAMAALTLLLEATAWLLFVRGRMRDAYVVAAVLFHIGTLFVLNISFLGLVAAYLAFYDLEVGVDRARAWLRQRLVAEATPQELPLR